MGRIKTSFIKNIGKDLFEKHSEKFSTDFDKNKLAVNGMVIFKSKKLRNVTAGYLTTLKKQQAR